MVGVEVGNSRRRRERKKVEGDGGGGGCWGELIPRGLSHTELHLNKKAGKFKTAAALHV